VHEDLIGVSALLADQEPTDCFLQARAIIGERGRELLDGLVAARRNDGDVVVAAAGVLRDVVFNEALPSKGVSALRREAAGSRYLKPQAVLETENALIATLAPLIFKAAIETGVPAEPTPPASAPVSDETLIALAALRHRSLSAFNTMLNLSPRHRASVRWRPFIVVRTALSPDPRLDALYEYAKLYHFLGRCEEEGISLVLPRPTFQAQFDANLTQVIRQGSDLLATRDLSYVMSQLPADDFAHWTPDAQPDEQIAKIVDVFTERAESCLNANGYCMHWGNRPPNFDDFSCPLANWQFAMGEMIEHLVKGAFLDQRSRYLVDEHSFDYEYRHCTV
jgi:hypothetical protein